MSVKPPVKLVAAIEPGGSELEKIVQASDDARKEAAASKEKAKTSLPTNKSATLGPSSHSTFARQARTNLRRSFTLPRSLFTKKHGRASPTPEPKNSNFVRLLLTLTRRKSVRRKKDQEDENPLPPGFTPGALGLKNQGNTCFMNAIVQCLSHTDELAKYLVTDSYKSDLRRKTWIKSGKGEVTEELATILRSTWLRQNSSVIEQAVTRFKAAVERGAQQWRGAQQHDAQEFLLWLLDRLHEDLNQASSNKYKPVKNNFGRPDEHVAAEALENHLRCNNSIIQDIFGAQFRSSLTCPGCGRQSATFDPFLCVSLPIPAAKQQCPVYVNVVYLAQQPRLVKLGLNTMSSADVKELKHLLSGDTGIEEGHILLCEIDGEGFHRTFTEMQPVSTLASNEAVYCLETPQPKETSEDGAFLLITWTNILVSNDGSTKLRFGSPYITQVARETGFVDLQKLLLKEMAGIIQQGVLVAEQKEPVVSIRILDGSSDGTLVDPSVEHPLYTEAVDHALSLCDDDVPPHVKMHLEWSLDDKDRVIADDNETVEEHSSVAQTRAKHSEETVSTVTLGECFDLYTTAEELSPEDSWHCPHCNRKEEGTLKMIALWSAPEVLVVHLKRFRQTLNGRNTATKISSIVDFPIDGLDLAPHVSRKSRSGADNYNVTNGGTVGTSPVNGCFGISSWKRASFKKHLPGTGSKRFSTNQLVNCHSDDSLVYDLYAVCNHHGKYVQGGHYTAYCKNPVEGTWWNFDDTRVEQLSSQDDVHTASAYILFYRKRNTMPSNGYHWCKNLVKKYHKNVSLATTTNLSSDTTTNGTTTTLDTQLNATMKVEETSLEGKLESSSNQSSSPPPLTHDNGDGGDSSDGNCSDSNSSSLSKSSSAGSNSAAPLARIEDMSFGLIGTTEIQLESTV